MTEIIDFTLLPVPPPPTPPIEINQNIIKHYSIWKVVLLISAVVAGATIYYVSKNQKNEKKTMDR